MPPMLHALHRAGPLSLVSRPQPASPSLAPPANISQPAAPTGLAARAGAAWLGGLG